VQIFCHQPPSNIFTFDFRVLAQHLTHRHFTLHKTRHNEAEENFHFLAINYTHMHSGAPSHKFDSVILGNRTFETRHGEAAQTKAPVYEKNGALPPQPQ
jgi:hypothetical protein